MMVLIEQRQTKSKTVELKWKTLDEATGNAMFNDS